MSTIHGWGNVARAFGNKQYRTYQSGRFVSQVAIWMYKVAIGWIVWQLTQSAAWLGIFGFLDQAPALIIMPLAGALTDRTDSLRFIRVTQAILLVHALLLTLCDAFDLLTLPVLIVFTLVNGAVSAAQLPASQAILPNIIPKGLLTSAYGLNSVLFNIARFTGPMVAGALISVWGTAPAIFCNAIGAAIFLFSLKFLRIEFEAPVGSRGGVIQTVRRTCLDVRDGFKYAVSHDGIGPTLAILSSLSVLPFTIDLLLPSLADGVYHAGAQGLSWMTSALGVGAMVQSAVIARRGGVQGLSVYVVACILGLGFAFVALSFCNTMTPALACVLVIGFMSSATRVATMTLVQYSVDINMRGRVASFYSVINQAGPAIGSLIVGAAADRAGMPLMLGLIGAFTLGVWAWAFPRRGAIARCLEIEADAYRAAAVRKAN